MLYIVSVCILGLTLTTSLIYGLSFDDTVSNNMLTYIPYRVLVSTCIVFQLGYWVVCIYLKDSFWGLLCTGVTILSWIGLTSVFTGTPHVVFVGLFVASFFIFMLILCYHTWQSLAGTVLFYSIGFQAITIIAMMVMCNNNKFYLMEHIAFICYSLIFTSFFLVHNWE